jgi:hypothetical protein
MPADYQEVTVALRYLYDSQIARYDLPGLGETMLQ